MPSAATPKKAYSQREDEVGWIEEDELGVVSRYFRTRGLKIRKIIIELPMSYQIRTGILRRRDARRTRRRYKTADEHGWQSFTIVLEHV